MANYLVGIDNGLTLSKVAVFDLEGRTVGVASRKITVRYPKPGYTERDMDHVWQKTAEAVREVMDVSGIAPKDILAIGNSGHGNGLYLLDRDGRAFRPSIASMDGRAPEIVDEWMRPGGVRDQAFPYTLQSCWAGQPSVLLAWLKRHEPDSYRKIGKVLLCTDYIKHCLTGEHTTDYSIISGSSLFDSSSGSFSRELLEIYGIPELFPAMPRPVWGHEIAGKVTPEAARQTGLVAGTPVTGGLFDIDAAAIGSGVISEGILCLIAGTWSINQVITSDPIVDKKLFLCSLFTVPGMWLTLEASPASATNLEWFVNNFCFEEKQEAQARGISVYEVCNEAVATLAPGSTDIIFHPYLFGSDVQATARAGFYGLGAWHTKAHVLRALYEGVVYGHMTHIEKLRAAGAKIEKARMTGGGSHSTVWTQMFSDALGLPIEVPEGAEVAARGAAMTAGIGAGVYRDYADAVTKVVQVERVHQPDPQASPHYLARFREYKTILEAMKEPWNRLAKLSA
jgi:L-xylulokinase